MESGSHFDLVVIGTGTAGSTVAHEARKGGWSVAVIDDLPFGGTCALRGCEPKKVLVEAAKVIDANRRHQSKGVFVPEKLNIHWSELLRFKNTFTEPFIVERENGFIKEEINTFHGTAKFENTNEITILDNSTDINKSGIDKKKIYGKKIVIASGSKPTDLLIQGTEHILTSDQFLSLVQDNLPEKIIFIGGGFISFEFAHVAARAGVKEITILHKGPRPLSNFDPDLVDLLLDKSKAVGINVKLNTTIEKVEKSSFGSENYSYKVHLVDLSPKINDLDSNENRMVISGDIIVHGAGRVANINNLDLEKGSIKFTSNGIMVNEFLQSITNPDVYAAGDVVASKIPHVTPKASFDGKTISTNLLNGNSVKALYNDIPRVVFTIPCLASVGMNEIDLKQSSIDFRTNFQDTSKWYTSRRNGESCSGFKILIENQTERILGAHLIGPHAEEVINIFSIAIKLGITTSELKNGTLYGYPTSSSDIPYMLS